MPALLKIFLPEASFFAQHFTSRGIYWRNPQEEAYLMETKFPHGDVDDLIYQEEWKASER